MEEVYCNKYVLLYILKNGLKVRVLTYISTITVCHFYGTTDSTDFHIPKKRLTRKLGRELLSYILPICETDYIIKNKTNIKDYIKSFFDTYEDKISEYWLIKMD